MQPRCRPQGTCRRARRPSRRVAALLLLVSVLPGCGSGGTPPPPPPVPALALHAFGPGHARLLTDVAYEIDTRTSWPTAFVRTLVENAPTKAMDGNAPFVHPDNTELRYQPFHFWPNVFHLTAIHSEDPALLGLILDAALAREPNAGVRAQTEAAIAGGRRVFLLRDFVDAVEHAGEVFHEVHFLLLVDLDAHTVTEVHAHRFPLARLPRIHDPRVEALVAAFQAPPAPGLAWDLCLRGNVERDLHESVLVDVLQDGRFHLARIAACGSGVLDPAFDGGLLPWIPRQPPKEPTPPTPKDDPPPVIIPDPDPPLNPGGVFTPPPVRPWPFPAPPPPELPPEPTEPSTGAPPSPSTGCALEVAAIAQRKDALEQAWQAGLDAWNADHDTLGTFRWRWQAGAVFTDPALQAEAEACDMEVAVLQGQLDAVEAQIGAAYDGWVASRDGKPLVVSTIPWTNSMWDQVLTLGGFWSRVRVDCQITVIFPDNDNTVIPVTPQEQTDFQRWIAYALMNGATWDAAVEEALGNDAAERARRGFTPGENEVFAAAWRQYADCLKDLQRQALQMFVAALQGLEDATQDEIDRIVEYMFSRDDAILTPAELQAQLDCAQARAGYAAEIATLRDTRAALEAQLEDKRLAFTAAARDGRMAERIDELDRMLSRRFILCAFPIWCQDPEAPDAFPLQGAFFCEELLALQTDPDFTAFPEFQAYVQMLLDFNC